MKKIFNLFLKTDIYNRIHKIVGRKVFKLTKIFFVETKHKSLPLSNHPLEINYEHELRKYYKAFLSKEIPFISYSHLVDLLKITEVSKKKQIRFLDYGAGNLELFATLAKNFKRLLYFYSDQAEYNQIIKRIKKNKKFKNLNIMEEPNKSKIKFDFVYFGGSLQYLPDYKKSLKDIFKKTNTIIISQTPFFFDNINKQDVVLKQVNLSKTLNYLYLINFLQLEKFMKKNKFYLVSRNYNRVIKFLNFKNLNHNYKNIDMYDLLFKKK